MIFYYFIFFAALFHWFYGSYSFYRTYKDYKHLKKFKFALALLNLAFAICLLLNPRVWQNLFGIKLYEMMTPLYYFMLSLMSMILVSFIIKDLFIILFLRPIERNQKDANNQSRRKFLRNSFSVFALANTTVIPAIGYAQAKKPTLKEVPILDPHFALEFGELTAIQVSDLHVGPIIKKEYIQKVRDLILLKKPHFIFYTGDMVDGNVADLGPEFEPLKNLRGSLGNYFVTGNHEYYSGVTQWLDFFKNEMGCEVLMNENRILSINGKKLMIAGVTDHSASRFNKAHKTDPIRAKGVDQVDYAICLAHQPKSVYKVKEAGFNFMCCGHTHGGQYVPFNLLVAMVQPYVKGLNNHDGMPVYVNSGTGYWGPPNRFGVPAEVTHFNFTHKS